MNALANWLGITDQNAPRDYDSEANRAGFWDTVRQMSALAIAAGARQSDGSRAQILGQLANVSSPTAGATRYAQANMQNMAAQRQREQYAADQNFAKGIDTMPGLNDQQRAILRAMGPAGREAYTSHGMNAAFEDPMVKMLRQSQIDENKAQAAERQMKIKQLERELARDSAFDTSLGIGSAGAPAPSGLPVGGPSIPAPAATGGAPFSSPSVAPQSSAPIVPGMVGNGTVGLSQEDMRTMRLMGMKRDDIMKKQAELIADNAKPEPGFQWTDGTRTKQMPIPGSSKEAVPAEVAARLGMGNQFLGNLPQIRSSIDAGTLSGPINSAKLGLGMGAQGELWRQIDNGIEAIVRLQTGMGQNESEIRANLKRYEPSTFDSVETIKSKVNGLESVLKEVMQNVYQGRGGMESRKPAAPTPFTFEENKRAVERSNGSPAQGGAGQIRAGMVMDGHVFLGGNPADKNAWRPISEGYAR